MNDKKTLSELEQLFAAGDAWLVKYGVVSPIMHNNIILNLYVHFPKVKYVEYYMSTKPEDRKIHVVMHYPFFHLLFRNRDAIVDSVIELLKEYLHEYEITVELKRYKKGAEKRHDTKAISSIDSSPKSSNTND